ncbi:acetolactate synthase small subunit [Acidobacteria bacterium ACD]|nr:MAG: acetolactate synthase small subunit [Acidobacteriota bacterium]MCE7959845.1 acetolactate synthase small subunit [Acidobacteria bacterium ACB2]MDL1948246.1 acetolactate synthase small subunit [Acidobacteria bacterium ACD]
MKHTLVARVLDQPGVLVRVVSMFRRRAFNVESLAVGHSETPGISRMTFVVDASRVPSRLVEANLRKLLPVVEVHDVTHVPAVARELALLRVACAANERSEIAGLIQIFRARIVDVAPDSVIVEVTGDVEKVDGLVELLRPRGIVEMVRTGKVAMTRGASARKARPEDAPDAGDEEPGVAA